MIQILKMFNLHFFLGKNKIKSQGQLKLTSLSKCLLIQNLGVIFRLDKIRLAQYSEKKLQVIVVVTRLSHRRKRKPISD